MKHSTNIQQLIQEYRQTRAPAQVSVDHILYQHNALTTAWFSPARAAFASVLTLTILLFVVAGIETDGVHESGQPYPSISLLSDAGISLSINTDSPDLSGLEYLPGLLDIAIPGSYIAPGPDNHEQQTKTIQPALSITIT